MCKSIKVFHPGDHPEYHVYEILQVFFASGCDFEFVPDSAFLAFSANEILEYIPVDSFDSYTSQGRYIYSMLERMTGYTSPWGALTGIRPAKICNHLIDEGMSDDAIAAYMKDTYLAEDDKIQMCIETAKSQRSFLQQQRRDPKRIGIYINIPFCPSRCLYCSFTSNSIVKYRKLVEPYMDMLYTELRAVKDIVNAYGLTVESVYIGGGTPTSLDEVTFERLVRNVSELFSFDEFSVEAGRPDSITRAKLRAAKEFGCDRISINPQTMNDKTLELIGRRHTASDILAAYDIACSEGFSNINMDIIAGLPGENEADFDYTLFEVSKLRPASLTVHTLSIKRAAQLKRDEKNKLLDSNIIANMLKASRQCTKALDMHPYYMYKQKNMLGNHENVAYCTDGNESLYNIHIMEEDQSILAVGAGGVSKLVGSTIERAFNVKSVEDYMKRMPEMIERKLELAKRMLV